MLNTDYSPAAYAQQLQTKQSRLHNLLSEFNAPEPQVFASSEQHYRLRAEFRLWREGDKRFYALFAPGDNRTPIFINTFPIGSTLINQLMPRLEAAWNASKALSDRLFQVEFLTTLSGEAMITLCYHRPLDEDWQAVAEQLASDLNVSIIGRSRGKRTVIGRDFVVEKLNVAGREFSYRQPEGAFTQPNGAVNTHMLNWAYEALGEQPDDLLELYCGNGNFTLPLSLKFKRVLATELAKSSVHAAQWNIEQNQIDNIQVARLSAEEFTQAYQGERTFRRLLEAEIDIQSYDFDTVFVDPPRAGIDDETLKLLQGFERIIYISCNPDTLHDNLKILTQTHRIQKFAMFDQFPFTHHVESGVLLEKI